MTCLSLTWQSRLWSLIYTLWLPSVNLLYIWHLSTLGNRLSRRGSPLHHLTLPSCSLTSSRILPLLLHNSPLCILLLTPSITTRLLPLRRPHLLCLLLHLRCLLLLLLPRGWYQTILDGHLLPLLLVLELRLLDEL